MPDAIASLGMCFVLGCAFITYGLCRVGDAIREYGKDKAEDTCEDWAYAVEEDAKAERNKADGASAL